MSVLARESLSIPSASVASEGYLSVLSSIITKTYKKLDPDTAEAQMVAHGFASAHEAWHEALFIREFARSHELAKQTIGQPYQRVV